MLLAIDVPTVAATVAVTVAVVGGLASGYAALRQRNTEDIGQVLTAQQAHMKTLSDENSDLRNRVTHAETQLLQLREEVWNCNRDKDRLRQRVEELESKVDGG